MKKIVLGDAIDAASARALEINRQSLAIDASSRVYAPSPSMDDPSRSPRVARRRKHDNGRHERARGDDGDEKWGRDTLPRRIGISLRFCPVGGANHSHRSRVRAERRTVVVEIAPKRYVRALTTLARARESERTFFSPRRVDRAGREWGRSGNHRRAASRPTAVGTPRVARARLTTIADDARGARDVDPDRSPNPRLFVSFDALFRVETKTGF